METKTERYYTPLVLRTGFFHSYSRTILTWVLIVAFRHLALFAWGVIVPEELVFDITLGLIILAATWTVRAAIDGYDELFDIFDEDSERKLKLYRSMDRPAVSTQDDVRRLFSNDEKYEVFKEKTRRIIFRNSELVPLSLGMLIIIAYWVNNILYSPDLWTYNGVVSFPWTHIHYTIYEFIGFPWVAVFACSGLWLIVGYLNIIRLMNGQFENLKIDNYVKHLQDDEQDIELMPYKSFYHTIAMIGTKVYRVSSQAVGALVVASLWLIALSFYNYGFMDWNAWLESVVIIPMAFLIFVIPQFGIHTLLANAKNSISESLDSVYDSLNVKLMQLSKRGFSDIETEQHKRKEELEYAYLQIQIVKLLDIEISKASTWTFEMPALLKLVGASLVPIGLGIMQTILLSAIPLP